MADHSIRRAQLVTTFGVGAMVPVGDESYMVAGLDFWPTGAPDLSEPRLERALGKHGFRQPPAGDGAPSVPAVRFPVFHTCPECRRLARHWDLADHDSNDCRTCGVSLVPSRFVVACENGHIDDFPYMQWLHQGRKWSEACKLELTSAGRSAALRDVIVRCSCGVPERSLDGAFNRFDLAQVASCRGNRPWLKDKEDGCTAQLRTLQRGASNVWFGSMRSALSIPPWSQAAFQAIERFWQAFRTVNDPVQLTTMLEGMGGEATFGEPVQELVQAAMARRAEEQESRTLDEDAFRRQEFEAIITGRSETGDADEFVAMPEEVPSTLTAHIGRVVLAHRLREVRVLQGFTRVRAGGPANERAPLSAGDSTWLPGIEVRGEGIFLQLNDEALTSWEQNQEVRARTKILADRYDGVCNDRGTTPHRPVTPRFVLLHTLAHALIDTLSFDAGYPAAALRERLYVADDMAALLIYTATTDSAGSLGGVVQQGEPERLERVVREAVGRHGWCSADPVCMESLAQGVDGLNLAACHSCSLLPETCCEERNTFLDRALLVGTPEHRHVGFFHSLPAAS